MFSGRPNFPVTASVSIAAKDVAAEAEVRKPARVMPIWIVERNFVGLFVSFKTSFAFLLPSSAIFSIFVSLREITAISAIAK